MIFRFYDEKNEEDEAWIFVLFTLYFFLKSVCICRYSCPRGAIATANGGFFLLIPTRGIRKKNMAFFKGFY